MATDDKHCQTFTIKTPRDVTQSKQISSNYVPQQMYDQTVPVLNAKEVKSPSGSESESTVGEASAAMSKFNPPVRHTARHDFDSGTDSDTDVENFLANASDEEEESPERKSRPLSARQKVPSRSASEESEKLLGRRSGFGRTSKQQSKAPDSSDNSDADSTELAVSRPPALPSFAAGRKRGAGLVVPAEGAYDPKHFQDLKVPPDLENVFQYIMKYTPQKIDIEFKLQPFIPEYVPSVGDIDPFMKVTTPACGVKGASLSEKLLEHVDNLGLTILDEPSAEQSDSALLHLQLRAHSKNTSAKSTVLTKKIEFAEKNPKSIERWIKDVSELHSSKPAPNVNYTVKMPDIDSLMEEWPTIIEDTLNDVGFPRPNLDCTLTQYVTLLCALFDIPLSGGGLNDYIQALHVLFSLFVAVKNSQLYAEREKDKGTVV